MYRIIVSRKGCVLSAELFFISVKRSFILWRSRFTAAKNYPARWGLSTFPGTMRFLSILTENGVMPQFINVTGSINLLKDFIYLRDTHPAFDAFRGTGRIGFPLVQLEDGTHTTDLDGVLDSFGK